MADADIIVLSSSDEESYRPKPDKTQVRKPSVGQKKTPNHAVGKTITPNCKQILSNSVSEKIINDKNIKPTSIKLPSGLSISSLPGTSVSKVTRTSQDQSVFNSKCSVKILTANGKTVSSASGELIKNSLDLKIPQKINMTVSKNSVVQRSGCSKIVAPVGGNPKSLAFQTDLKNSSRTDSSCLKVDVQKTVLKPKTNAVVSLPSSVIANLQHKGVSITNVSKPADKLKISAGTSTANLLPKDSSPKLNLLKSNSKVKHVPVKNVLKSAPGLQQGHFANLKVKMNEGNINIANYKRKIEDNPVCINKRLKVNDASKSNLNNLSCKKNSEMILFNSNKTNPVLPVNSYKKLLEAKSFQPSNSSTIKPGRQAMNAFLKSNYVQMKIKQNSSPKIEMKNFVQSDRQILPSVDLNILSSKKEISIHPVSPMQKSLSEKSGIVSKTSQPSSSASQVKKSNFATSLPSSISVEAVSNYGHSNNKDKNKIHPTAAATLTSPHNSSVKPSNFASPFLSISSKPVTKPAKISLNKLGESRKMLSSSAKLSQAAPQMSTDAPQSIILEKNRKFICDLILSKDVNQHKVGSAIDSCASKARSWQNKIAFGSTKPSENAKLKIVASHAANTSSKLKLPKTPRSSANSVFRKALKVAAVEKTHKKAQLLHGHYSDKIISYKLSDAMEEVKKWPNPLVHLNRLPLDSSFIQMIVDSSASANVNVPSSEVANVFCLQDLEDSTKNCDSLIKINRFAVSLEKNDCVIEDSSAFVNVNISSLEAASNVSCLQNDLEDSKKNCDSLIKTDGFAVNLVKNDCVVEDSSASVNVNISSLEAGASVTCLQNDMEDTTSNGYSSIKTYRSAISSFESECVVQDQALSDIKPPLSKLSSANSFDILSSDFSETETVVKSVVSDIILNLMETISSVQSLLQNAAHVSDVSLPLKKSCESESSSSQMVNEHHLNNITPDLAASLSVCIPNERSPNKLLKFPGEKERLEGEVKVVDVETSCAQLDSSISGDKQNGQITSPKLSLKRQKNEDSPVNKSLKSANGGHLAETASKKLKLESPTSSSVHLAPEEPIPVLQHEMLSEKIASDNRKNFKKLLVFCKSLMVDSSAGEKERICKKLLNCLKSTPTHYINSITFTRLLDETWDKLEQNFDVFIALLNVQKELKLQKHKSSNEECGGEDSNMTSSAFHSGDSNDDRVKCNLSLPVAFSSNIESSSSILTTPVVFNSLSAASTSASSSASFPTLSKTGSSSNRILPSKQVFPDKADNKILGGNLDSPKTSGSEIAITFMADEIPISKNHLSPSAETPKCNKDGLSKAINDAEIHTSKDSVSMCLETTEFNKDGFNKTSGSELAITIPTSKDHPASPCLEIPKYSDGLSKTSVSEFPITIDDDDKPTSKDLVSPCLEMRKCNENGLGKSNVSEFPITTDNDEIPTSKDPVPLCQETTKGSEDVLNQTIPQERPCSPSLLPNLSSPSSHQGFLCESPLNCPGELTVRHSDQDCEISTVSSIKTDCGEASSSKKYDAAGNIDFEPVPSTSKQETFLSNLNLGPSTSSAPQRQEEQSKNSVHSRTALHIRMLERRAKKLQKNIKKMEEVELSLDDLDSETSVYLLEAKYKKKLMEVYNKLCELQKVPARTGRWIEKKFKLQESRFQQINEAVQDLINRREMENKFPDYAEIHQIVKDLGKDIGLDERLIDCEARRIFTEVGIKLKRRRLKDTNEALECFVPEESVDPAEQDPDIQKRLSENAERFQKSTQEIFDKYALLQENYVEEEDILEEEDKLPLTDQEDSCKRSNDSDSDSDCEVIEASKTADEKTTESNSDAEDTVNKQSASSTRPEPTQSHSIVADEIVIESDNSNDLPDISQIFSIGKL